MAHCEIGLVRKSNQDSGFVSSAMLLVADGMGGAAAGDIASAVTARDLRKLGNNPGTGPEVLDSWREALTEVNTSVAEMILANPRLDGMGTTVCGGIFDGEELHIAHIGDSRGYLFSHGELTQLTHDHSYVQSLVDDGKIKPEEAMVHPHRSLLLKVLNGQPEIAPDFFSHELIAGDRVMFCSDGLCGLVPDEDIAQAMALPDLSETLLTLTAFAHAAGGTDNITIILADVVEVKSLAAGGTPPPKIGENTIAFDADLALLDQDALPVVEVRTSGLLGAAADPKIISRIKAGRKAAGKLQLPQAKASGGTPPTTITETEKHRYSLLSKKKWWLQVLITLLIILGLAGGAWAVRSYIYNQYYIGEYQGVVAIYQGLPGDIAGVSTSWLYEATTIRLADLPLSYRDRVTDHITTSGGLDQARIAVAQLKQTSRDCVEARLQRPPETPPPLDGC
jgi:protein phosphatase